MAVGTMQFYKPHPWFLDRLVELAGGRLVIECGCGEGHLLKALLDLGVDAYGLELFPRGDLPISSPLMGRILPVDALECQMLLKAKDALIIVARPNHSGWFQRLLEVADPSCDILYIGLRKNVACDGASDLAILDVRPVAEDDETEEPRGRNRLSAEDDPNHIVRVRPSLTIMAQNKRDSWKHEIFYLFCLVQNESTNECFWGEPRIGPIYNSNDELVFVNESGGYAPRRKTDRIIRTIMAINEKFLDRKETSEYKSFLDGSTDKSLMAGWIDRSGQFYRCRYTDHIRLLFVLFGMTEEEAEKKGWVKVHQDDGFSGAFWSFDLNNRGIRLTLEQVSTLRNVGFPNVDEDDTFDKS
jgi:hypothetical protein